MANALVSFNFRCENGKLIQGLLRTGAMKESDKPVWYDVYAAFPPRVEPKYDRYVSERVPINILYNEDILRAKFYKTFGSPDVIDMSKEDNHSLAQRFIEKYNDLDLQKSHTSSELFQLATDALRAEGITLKTLEEIDQERKARKRLAGDVISNQPVLRVNSDETEQTGDGFESETIELDYLDEDRDRKTERYSKPE